MGKFRQVTLSNGSKHLYPDPLGDSQDLSKKTLTPNQKFYLGYLALYGYRSIPSLAKHYNLRYKRLYLYSRKVKNGKIFKQSSGRPKLLDDYDVGMLAWDNAYKFSSTDTILSIDDILRNEVKEGVVCTATSEKHRHTLTLDDGDSIRICTQQHHISRRSINRYTTEVITKSKTNTSSNATTTV